MIGPREQRFVILDELGLHALVATRFAQVAAAFDARIEVECAGAVGNGKCVMEVLTLVAAAGDEVTVRAEGPDSAAALAALTEIVTTELGAMARHLRAEGRR